MKSCLLVIIIFCSSFLHAGYHGGVRAQSFGGSDRARSDTNNAIFYNPAGIIKKRAISPNLDYIYESQEHDHQLGISLVDSSTGIWGLGLAYVGYYTADRQVPNAHQVYLTAAMPIVTDMIVLGTSLYYTYDKLIGPDPHAHFFNMNVGFLVNLPIGLSFAAVADNIIKPKGKEKDLGFALAVAYDLGAVLPIVPLSVSFDWAMEDVKHAVDLHHVVMTGVQYNILDMIPIRFGYRSDLSAKQQLVSIGLGLNSGIMMLDALYQQNINLGKDRYFGFALRFNI